MRAHLFDLRGTLDFDLRGTLDEAEAPRRLPNRGDAVDRVDVLSPQPERFAPAQPEHQLDHIQRMEWVVPRRPQQPLGLFAGLGE